MYHIMRHMFHISNPFTQSQFGINKKHVCAITIRCIYNQFFAHNLPLCFMSKKLLVFSFYKFMQKYDLSLR